MKLFLAAILAVSAFGQGTAIVAGTMTQITAGGYPFALVGYDKAVYVSSRDCTAIWGNYRTGSVTSEINDAMMCYSYTENRWHVLSQGGAFHSAQRIGGGHSFGNMDYAANIDTLFWNANSGAQAPEMNYITAGLDLAGLSTRIYPLMTTAGTLKRQWVPGGSSAFYSSGYDQVNHKWVFFPDFNLSTGAAQICTLSTMACVAATTTNGPSGTLDEPPLVFSSYDNKMYVYASGSGDIYRLDASAGTWEHLTTTCTGADCTSNHPPTRIYSGFAYSSTDALFLMLGGTVSIGSGAKGDIWTFNPATLVWNEVCASSCGYATSSSVPIFNRIAYDSTNNIFILFTYASGVYAYPISTPLNYGRTTTNYAPSAGSLNKVSPSTTPGTGTAQGFAFDLYVSGSVNNFYLAHNETALPTNVGSCQTPVPYMWLASGSGGGFLPTGTLAAGCAAIGQSTGNTTTSSSVIAEVGGTVWVAYERHGAPSATAAQAFASSYNAGTGLWSGAAIGCFSATCFSVSAGPVQYPTELIAAGSTPTVAVVEENQNLFARETYAYVAQYSGGTWSALGGVKLNINAASSGTYVNSLSVAATAANNLFACWAEEVNSSRTTMGTTPQIQCKSWDGSTWTRMGAASLNKTASDFAYSPSVTYASGVPYVTWTECTQTGNLKLYVMSWNGSAWANVGSNPLNIDTTNGLAYHPRLASNGADVYLAWGEQAAVGSHALGHVKLWNSGAWAAVGGNLAADTTNGSISDIGIAYVGSRPTVAWTELTFGNLPQVYLLQWNGTTWGALGATPATRIVVSQ